MTALAHAQHSTQVARPLAEITQSIFSRIDSFVLDIGAELQYAFEHHRADYDEWVTRDLPFSLDKARRLRMIWKAHQHLPADVLERLPRAWQSLYAVSRLGPEQVAAAVDDGSLHPELTVVATNELVRSLQGNDVQPRHSPADILVGKLVTQPVSMLGDEAESLLRRWLDTR